MLLETDRLVVRCATASDQDIEMYLALWNHPKVMEKVGFPEGLNISREEVAKILSHQPEGPFGGRLVVVDETMARSLGEAHMRLPDEDGISRTDVKLFPEHWGQGFGTEVKQGLVDYLFTHTDCRGIMADPRKDNLASQKMQERRFTGA